MSAKEMFEMLGYKQFANNSVEKMYHNDKYTIIFNKMNLEIYCTCIIDMKLLQAINKQVEELGWNECLK